MFQRIRRTLVLASCVLGMSLAAIGAAQAQGALADIMAAKQIKIGIPTDFPPYGFVGADMQPQGLDVEMGRYIGEKLGVKVELIAVTSPNRIPYLQTKRADLIISTLGKSPDREKVIDFTAAYAPFFSAVYGPKSMSIKTFADLAGKSVSVTRGAIEDIDLTKMAPPETDIKRFEDNNATVSAFVSGQANLIATGASVAESMMQRNPQLNTEYKLLTRLSGCYIGVPKGEDALRNKINEIIAAGIKNGDLEKLSQKWLKRGLGDLPG